MRRPYLSGDLDRRVQFLRAELIFDGYQTRPGPHEPFGAPVWARKRPISDAERYTANTVSVDAVARFVIRWSSFAAGIDHADRLTCEGVTYAISGIKEIGRREMIEITASKIG